ncbi:MAG TPA: hypothetical protein P5249_08385 [Smithellaceae bacterium]|nr:hypothetical protein [Smithellaceae bacterium]
MTMELGLLLLESILLVVTIILLVYSIHEGKQRDSLLKEMGRATRILTRQEYFFTLLDTMLDARREIIGCITGSPPSAVDVKMTRDVAAAIERMVKKGVRVRYLLPKYPDRLQVGVQYTKAGAEVHFSSCAMVHSLRYSIIDERVIVLGIPESTGEREATQKGYKIPSEELSVILKNYFNTCEQQVTIKDYLKEIIDHTGATPAHLAREYHVAEQDLAELLR